MSTQNLPWDLFETFLAVMEGGSLSAASRSLKTAQPTIRRRIEALETALGSTLFTRATNGLVPTEAAHETVIHARAMAASARAMIRSTSGASTEPRGTVRIAASDIVGTEVLPLIWSPLLGHWPELQLEVVLSNQLADLLRRDADIAVRMTKPTQAALVARRVGVIPVGLFADQRYLAKHAAPKTLAGLKDHALIGRDRDHAFLDALNSVGANLTPRHLRVRTDSDVAQLSAVRAGLGIGVCQVPLAKRLKLHRVLPKVVFPLECWVVMHEDLRAVRRVRLVFEHLVSHLKHFVV